MSVAPRLFPKSCSGLLLAAVVVAWLMAGGQSAQAVVLANNFNDVAVGDLNATGGGSGYAGNWSGSNALDVVVGNLTSSLYSVTQTGTAQRVLGTNQAAIRQNFRTPTTALTGEVWFSYLAQTQSGTGVSSAGISLNAPTGTPFDDRGSVFYMQFTGNDLIYSVGGAAATTLTGLTTSGTTALVVGRLVISGAGNDTLSVWVNPDLVANPDINAYTAAFTSTGTNFISSLATVGVIAYRSNGNVTGGYLDNVRFSDGGGNATTAYNDVTGVPEPGKGLLMLIGIAAGVLRRRR